ncbi:MAG: endonuclease/exonuclease/phosphatase family protein [Bacteroidota bacterium]
MAKEFSQEEWDKIFAELDRAPDAYGLPRRVYGSAVVGSFNVRKLGNSRNRGPRTWKFLGRVSQHFDLLAIQEVLDDMSGLNRLMEQIGPEWGMIVSDKTGVYPGDRGVGERLAFFFRWNTVQRGEVVSDITYDRSKVTQILFDNLDEVVNLKAEYDRKLADYESGKRKTKPKLDAPIFLSFIRQPFCVSFQIKGFPGTEPYRFMAINAHLIYGTMADRKREFKALMEWITDRVKDNDHAYYPNFMLLGDLNLNFDDPDKDMADIEGYLKSFNDAMGEEVEVNFPFLDVHPSAHKQYTSNVKLTQRYDQIGLFFREKGLPTYLDNEAMGKHERGPDYGVFNFSELFSVALLEKSFTELTKEEQDDLVDRYQHEVSDHLPIWVRLKLPDHQPGKG